MRKIGKLPGSSPITFFKGIGWLGIISYKINLRTQNTKLIPLIYKSYLKP
jgi:hypothetical protein